MPRHTVLVTDDEPCITYMLATRLGECGMNVITASDGDEAFALAIANRPTVIVTDFQMPRMSGLELAKRLRAHPATADTPVVMLTARGHRVSPVELQETNVQHLMPKPFSARELQEVVEDFCASRPTPTTGPQSVSPGSAA